MLKKYLHYSNDEIDVLPVRTGVRYLEDHYDEQMQANITELGIHGIDVKNVEECGTAKYKLWLARKNSQSQPKQELTMSVEDIEKMNARMNKAIFKAIGKKIIDQKVLK